MLKIRPGHENVIGELEAADEAALGDAAVQEIAVTRILVLGFLAGDRQQAFLGFDVEFRLGETGNRDLDGEGVFADALDVIRGIALRPVEAGGLVDHAGEAVEADHRAVEGGEVNRAHGSSVLSLKATGSGKNHPVSKRVDVQKSGPETRRREGVPSRGPLCGTVTSPMWVAYGVYQEVLGMEKHR